MGKAIGEEKIAQLVTQFSAVLQQPIRKVTRPGGADRPIYRVYTDERTVIVAERADTDAAAKERAILTRLAPLTNRVPSVLAYEDGLTYLSDCGTERLSVAIYRAQGEDRLNLALHAIDALGEMHHAAAQIDWSDMLDPLGADRAWIRHFARGPDRLAQMLGLDLPRGDVDALQALLTVETPRFVKWDSRMANATLSSSGRVHWIDFELAGLRHGIEDYAWMVCDEVFPLNLAEHFPALRNRILAGHPEATPDTGKIFEVFATLHASLRLRVIVNELKEKSWTAQRDILAWDLVGADPYMAERLARNGGYLARLNPETEAFAPLFDTIEQKFRAAHG